ncbi:M56 family metallopeptidase [Formosa maritima]|uniref:M56 family metallopeptidase n=1 Tax=Formosa maritima TaxID=2592046 RepID=A0A5D0G2I0_9FLAO|nr:M56 family metallopeptidase [Formosa maritima]TYA53078.1 M56 family metallopeptidase [Formosa maritima]
MLEYIIKSSTCLVVFMLFYKLFLENENMHVFKRFYLLASVLVSFGVPYITFTQIIEVPVTSSEAIINNSTSATIISVEDPFQYLSFILWSIYFLGVLFFAVKFIYNLNKIFLKIKQNSKLKTKKSINVLLEELIVPHTFLSYIFLNKIHFETQQIPKEVLIHEEAHAVQKHSLDILFIEICQIVLWFNPLIYILKKSMKLNHEFLADREVINQGVSLSTYQQILLAFSSNVLEPQLASAINYSSIKKRFTVMKTSSSKTGIWLRSIVLLPMLALLIYSFSTKKVIEKDTAILSEISHETQQKVSPEELAEYNKLIKQYNLKPEATRVVPLNDLKKLESIFNKMTVQQKENAQPFPNYTQQLIPTINGIPCEGGCTVNISREATEKLILGTNTDEEVISFLIKFIGKPTVKITGNRLNKEAIALVNENEPNKNIQIFNIKTTNSNIPLPILIQLVDKNDKNYSDSPILKKGDLSNIPPPPVPPKAPEMKKAHDLPPPPPPIPADATPEEKVKYQKTIEEYNKWYNTKVKKGEVSNIPPPPPPPKSPLDFVIDMAKKGATFYFEGEKIPSDKAISILKDNKSMNISSKNSSSKNPKVYLSKDPITIDD